MEVVESYSAPEVVESHSVLEVVAHQQQSQPLSPGKQAALLWHTPTQADGAPSRGERVKSRNWVIIVTIVIAVTAIVVGAAIGGGLGASLASCKRDLGAAQSSGNVSIGATVTLRDPPSTTINSAAFETTTSGLLVNYEVKPPLNVFNLSLDCDDLSASQQVTPLNEFFLVYCDVDLTSGPRTDKSGNDVILADIISIISYSMADCLEACSQYNRWSQQWDVDNECGSVTFAVQMAENAYGNCWLKNSTVMPGTLSHFGYISATKIS
ncbi:hypothetical protein HD806DRAFT_526223 [Xylariaceae sp. AK1471]|nr:hypothetical protein HD806DRAFT_526223 [Xylariaceae sp. AK1471]